ncbi:VOC family protein [Streptomyces cucumeris]|uniref:VOC family protein n=1 Tax=Streptomyces cucumeris TaxID=2962890 RepID=UPI003EBC66FA
MQPARRQPPEGLQSDAAASSASQSSSAAAMRSRSPRRAATRWGGIGVVLWFRTPDAHQLHKQLVAAGIKILAPMTDSPFGPVFSFEGPEGYTLTAHGG